MKHLRTVFLAGICFLVAFSAGSGVSQAICIHSGLETAGSVDWDVSVNAGNHFWQSTDFNPMSWLETHHRRSHWKKRLVSAHHRFEQRLFSGIQSILIHEEPVGTSQPVPEPATMLLFGTGLVGLAGIVKRSSLIKH